MLLSYRHLAISKTLECIGSAGINKIWLILTMLLWIAEGVLGRPVINVVSVIEGNAHQAVSVEVSFRSDISIQKMRVKSINETISIAECFQANQECYLVKQEFGEYYSITYTHEGALFNIMNVCEETGGVYRLCQARNVCSTIEIKGPQITPIFYHSDSEWNGISKAGQNTAEENEYYAGIFIGVLATLVCLVLALMYSVLKKVRDEMIIETKPKVESTSLHKTWRLKTLNRSIERMSSLCIWGLCLGQVTLASCDDVSVRQLSVLTAYSFQCASKVDITFYRDNLNESIPIAECKTILNACYLLDQKYGKFYSVAFTDIGCIFNVIEIDETRGDYKCCDTRTCVNMVMGRLKHPIESNQTTALPPDDIPGTNVATGARIEGIVIGFVISISTCFLLFVGCRCAPCLVKHCRVLMFLRIPSPVEYEELANEIHELLTLLRDKEQELTDIQSTPPISPEKEPELPPPVPHLPHGAHGTHIGTHGTHVGNGTKPEPVVGASGPAGVPESTLLSSPSLPMKSPLGHVKAFLL